MILNIFIIQRVKKSQKIAILKEIEIEINLNFISYQKIKAKVYYFSQKKEKRKNNWMKSPVNIVKINLF